MPDAQRSGSGVRRWLRRYAALRAPHAHSTSRRRHADPRLRGCREHGLPALGGRRPAGRRSLVRPHLEAASWSQDGGDPHVRWPWRARPLAPARAGDRSVAVRAARRRCDGGGGLEQSRRAGDPVRRHLRRVRPGPQPQLPAKCSQIAFKTESYTANPRRLDPPPRGAAAGDRSQSVRTSRKKWETRLDLSASIDEPGYLPRSRPPVRRRAAARGTVRWGRSTFLYSRTARVGGKRWP